MKTSVSIRGKKYTFRDLEKLPENNAGNKWIADDIDARFWPEDSGPVPAYAPARFVIRHTSGRIIAVICA